MLVAIVHVPAPPSPDAAAAMERRFAERLPLVQQAPGFLGFELLRPAAGASHYLSISRWRSRADFDAWATSAANAQAHGRPEPAGTAGAVSGHGASTGPHTVPAGSATSPAGVELYEVCDM